MSSRTQGQGRVPEPLRRLERRRRVGRRSRGHRRPRLRRPRPTARCRLPTDTTRPAASLAIRAAIRTRARVLSPSSDRESSSRAAPKIDPTASSSFTASRRNRSATVAPRSLVCHPSRRPHQAIPDWSAPMRPRHCAPRNETGPCSWFARPSGSLIGLPFRTSDDRSGHFAAVGFQCGDELLGRDTPTRYELAARLPHRGRERCGPQVLPHDDGG